MTDPATLFEPATRGLFIDRLVRCLGWLAVLVGLCKALLEAYEIRLYAIQTYGPVIHEFDPWFNYRAAEYLAANGFERFFKWFDHTVWYPLGRPVGTTIYPGMQVVAVLIWKALGMLGQPWTLNEVCCYVPAWFGASASFFTGLLAYEAALPVGGAPMAFLCSTAVMAVIPAHARRSVGGGFDNESVAITPMCAAFYFWTRSLRTPNSWPVAALSGLCFSAMAASWGGYLFASNVIAAHCGICLLFDFDFGILYKAYSTFFVVGMSLACKVPVVSYAPFKTLEQLPPLGLFLLMQVLAIVRQIRRRKLRLGGIAGEYIFGAVGIGAIAVLYPLADFAPLSGRVHAILGATAQKTGNPLVDSVSEHRPTSEDAYLKYLHYAGYLGYAGFSVLIVAAAPKFPSMASLFALLLGVATRLFSMRMSRLLILMGPSTSVLAGVALGWSFHQLLSAPGRRLLFGGSLPEGKLMRLFHSWPVCLIKVVAFGALLLPFRDYCDEFYNDSKKLVRSMSHPQIMSKKGGKIIDDIREAYFWLQANTAPDARILSWWDYGYQISGIANRTTLADGNTWNMEHIGLIGRALTSPLSEGHIIARHLADYVLVWNKDVGKSSHMARIANSVFPGHCQEKTCDQYGTFRDGTPTRMMRESLIWNLIRDRSPEFGHLYQPVFENDKVRIARILNIDEESKAWAGNPANYLCDAPGSWYCPGQYPPKLRQVMGWEQSEDNDEAARHLEAYEERVERQRTEAPPPHADDIPEGSYRNSCQGCRREGADRKILSCHGCKAPGHSSMASRLDLGTCSGRTVDNIKGELQCHPLPNAPNIPPGGYANSCLGCSISDKGGDKLICTHCSTADGARQRSSIRWSSCNSGRIDNNNGNLVCLDSPNAPDIPPGGYQGSCSGCSVHRKTTTKEEGGGEAILRCEFCSAANGAQAPSEIRLSQCPAPGKLQNNDGTLTCERR